MSPVSTFSMASKRVIIASNKVGSFQDLISHDENGFVFSHDEPSELIDILIALDKDKLTQMGINASKSIDNWSFQILVNNILKAINKKVKPNTN